MSDTRAPTSHALQWRTPSPVPVQWSTERKHSEDERADVPPIQQRNSSDATWTESDSRHRNIADQQEGHVHWAQRNSQQQHPHDSVADEAHHVALGMSRRGSFFPGHVNSDDRSGQAEQSGLRDYHASQQHHGHVDPSPAKQSTGSVREPGSFESASVASGGYQPHSLKDYRDNDYDPKQRSYWTLGTLGKDPDTAAMQRKKENAEKVRDLSQAIREQNMAARASSPTRQPRPSPQQEPKKPSTRERAVEYARNLPRAPSPTKKRRSREGGSGVQHMGLLAEGLPAPSVKPSMALLMDIEELEALHGQQQKQVEQIYKDFGRGLSH